MPNLAYKESSTPQELLDQITSFRKGWEHPDSLPLGKAHINRIHQRLTHALFLEEVLKGDVEKVRLKAKQMALVFYVTNDEILRRTLGQGFACALISGNKEIQNIILEEEPPLNHACAIGYTVEAKSRFDEFEKGVVHEITMKKDGADQPACIQTVYRRAPVFI
jgi:hypothetical protein